MVKDKRMFVIVDHVMSGGLTRLPEKESSIVRVFLSSTFTDMQVERNWLMKNAVPHLRKFCQERGLDFQIADMRWGVREDATDDHKTTELCLQEIKNCEKISRGPYFVGFLGDKYGYRPLPAEIPASEFRLLKNTGMKLGHDSTVLLTWYLCDNNREPSMYIFQPISSLFPHYFDLSPANAGLRQQAQRDWWTVVDKIQQYLRDAARVLYKEGKLTKQHYHKYFWSVTENEVDSGIFQADDKSRVICFLRTMVDISLEDKNAGRFTDVIDGNLDLEAEELRERLRLLQIPPAVLPQQLYRYNIPWDHIGVNIFANTDHIRYIDQFGKDFVSVMENTIETALTKSQDTNKGRSPLFEEVLHHLHFCQTKCQTFCGRENLLNEIKTKFSTLYEDKDKMRMPRKDVNGLPIKSDEEKKKDERDAEWRRRKEVYKERGVVMTLGDADDDFDSDPKYNITDRLIELPKIKEYTKPIVVYGRSGSGKTALMAKVMESSKEWLLNSVGIVRFLGTSTMSTTIREVLLSLCAQIWHVYKIQKPTGLDLENDYQLLVKYFIAVLWSIDSKKSPLVIVLDSIDQLQGADHAFTFNWIPHQLPSNVHLIVSMVPNRNDCLKNIRQIFTNPDQYIEVTKMESSMANEMINVLCKKANQHLSKKQRNLLLEKFELCSQPLFLKLLVDMALSWRSYNEIDAQALGVTVKEAINHLFDNLEKSHGSLLIQKGVGYLCASREGLTEAEVEDLLSLDDHVLQDTYIYHLPPDPDVIRLPPLLWIRVQHDISEYVVERQSGGKKVVTWYHRQFTETLHERYLTQDIRQQIHVVMAEYFQGVWSEKNKPLELSKGKKGSYPNARRQVPAQPIRFSQNMYNTRKLSELPFHLTLSRQFQTLMTEVFCNPEWLYAKCHTMSLTALMEDLRSAEQKCADFVVELKQQADFKQQQQTSINKKQTDCQTGMSVNAAVEVFEGIKQVARLILMASDLVRKDPVYIPVQILAQLGRGYKGNVYIEQLVSRCMTWCMESDFPLLVPQCECLMRPGANLLYTIHVDHTMTGEKKDWKYKVMYLREDVSQLYMVKQRVAKKDQMVVFDLHDNGSCITVEDVNKYIRTIQFMGNDKYLVLETYVSKEEHNPDSQYQLYQSSTTLPILSTCKSVDVSTTGKYLALSEGCKVKVYLGNKDLQLHLTAHGFRYGVSAIFISPDESLILISNYELNELYQRKDEVALTHIYDLETKQQLHTVDGALVVVRTSIVTKDNKLITTRIAVTGKARWEREIIVVIYDMLKGETKKEIKLKYKPDLMTLHKSSQYVWIGYQSSVVFNGVNDKFAALMNIETLEMCGECPVDGPYNNMEMFGEEELYYVVCPWKEDKGYILYAGPVSSPLAKAVVMYVLIGHNKPIKQVLISNSMDKLLTAGADNTVKVWDLRTILEGFTTELARIRESLSLGAGQGLGPGQDPEVGLEEVIGKFSLPQEKEVCNTTQLALNRTGDTLYVGTDTSELRVYNTNTGQLKMSSDLDLGPIGHMLLSRSGRYIIAAGDKKVHVEDLHSTQPLVMEARGPIACMAEANNNLVVGSSGMEAKARVWNIQTGEILKDFESLYSLSCVAISASGTKMLCTMFDFPLVIDLEDPQGRNNVMRQDNMDTEMSSAKCCDISPDDKYGVAGSNDGGCRVIQMNGKYIYKLQQRSSVITVTFTPDSRSILSSGYRSIYVWAMEDGSLRYKLNRHLDFVTKIQFDNTGQYLVSFSNDKQLVFWEFNRSVSLATFHTQCQTTCIDMTGSGELIAYIPESIADLAILKPNNTLKMIADGKHKGLNLTPQTQGVALTFTGQRVGQAKSSQSCTVM